jgi:hypothetical protein
LLELLPLFVGFDFVELKEQFFFVVELLGVGDAAVLLFVLSAQLDC